jgi:hypothetical protein
LARWDGTEEPARRKLTFEEIWYRVPTQEDEKEYEDTKEMYLGKRKTNK